MRQETIVSYHGTYRKRKHKTYPELHFLQSIFVSEDAPLIPELKQAAVLPDLLSRAVPPLPVFPLKNVNPLSLPSQLPPFTLGRIPVSNKEKFCLKPEQ